MKHYLLFLLLPLGLSAMLSDEVHPFEICNPPLSELEEVAATLKEDEIATVSYLPRESHHWRLVEFALFDNLPDSIVSMYIYRDVIEGMGLKIISAEQTHNFAFYASRMELMEEIHKHPALWPISLNTEQIDRFADCVEHNSLPLGNLNFPYTMIRITFKK